MTPPLESSSEKMHPPGTERGDKIADLGRDTRPCRPDDLTTDYGIKVSDTDNWLRVIGPGQEGNPDYGKYNGPNLLEDQIGREKLHRFDHERIPERVVHARGTAAHGYFKVSKEGAKIAKQYTYAPVLTDDQRETPVFVRFSTVQGPRGSSDTVRDIRGFAIKLFTEEGNWDIVGNDIPVFFIQDAMKFPDFIHAVKPEPDTEVPTGQSAHNNFWDFVGLQPEATHTVMWAMSDRGIPRSLRMVQGFGVNTYTLLNDKMERHFVKFHFIPYLGVHGLIWDEALKIAGQDPDFHRKDLNEAIQREQYPKWKFSIQVLPEAREHEFDFDILDATKIWPLDDVPLQEIGEMVLDRVVDEFFTETEQVAFCTSHVVPGIGFSDDPLLQGRNFSYFDTQITRLGVNFEELPINRPVCPVFNNNRDGHARHRIIKGNINYFPNRKKIGMPVPASRGGYAEFAERVDGIKKRARGEKFTLDKNHYIQSQLFVNSLGEFERFHLISAISFELSHCDEIEVRETYINEVLINISLTIAMEVAKNVGVRITKDPKYRNSGETKKGFLPEDYWKPVPTVATRRIAILVEEGFNVVGMNAVREALTKLGAFCYIVGPHLGPIKSMEGREVSADDHFEGQRSTLFDAIYIPSGDHIQKLAKNGRVIHWVREAFGHCKSIAAVGEAVIFLRDNVQLPPQIFFPGVGENYGIDLMEQCSASGDVSAEFIAKFEKMIEQHRFFNREKDGLTMTIAF